MTIADGGKREKEGPHEARRLFPFLLSRLTILLAALTVAACGESGKGTTAYVGAQVFDGTGSPLIHDAVILVAGGKIQGIGTPGAVKVPRGATVVRLDGKWIIPGLIDGHTHVARWALPRYLAYGVTAVRDVGGNTDTLVALRSETGAGTVDGPRLYISGAMIDGAPATWTDAYEAIRPEDGRRAVDKLVLADVSQIKVYTKIDRPLLEAIADEAKQFHIPITAHLGKVDALTAAQLGVSTLEHMSGVVEASVRDPAPYVRANDDFLAGWKAFERGWAGLDSATLDRTARKLVAAKVSIVPTLVQHETYAHLEDSVYIAGLDLAGVPADVRRDWDIPDLVQRAELGAGDYAAFRLSRPVEDRFVRLYHRAGGLVVAGTDSPNQLLAPGASLHHELELLVRAGLSPQEALLAATRDGAALLRADSLGVLRPGAVADFVVLGGNPLEDIRNTRRVERLVSRGVERTAAELRRGWERREE